MGKSFILIALGFLLTSCNLTAQLVGGGQKFTYTETYTLQGDAHSFTTTFTLIDGKVAELTFEPGATTPSEHGEQLAFFANIRRHVLGKTPAEIILPNEIGEASAELIGAFGEAVTKLRESR